jgi:hypothetical protein
MHMGQYFLAVNETKKEYVSPWDIGGLAKLWEWCANRIAGIFPYLLRKSSEGGGGDIDIPDPKYAGRWAGDKVCLVGDYDDSNLFDRAEKEFTNISKPLAEEYNDFIEVEKLQLEVNK